jgi:hypothetical protein
MKAVVLPPESTSSMRNWTSMSPVLMRVFAAEGTM